MQIKKASTDKKKLQESQLDKNTGKAPSVAADNAHDRAQELIAAMEQKETAERLEAMRKQWLEKRQVKDVAGIVGIGPNEEENGSGSAGGDADVPEFSFGTQIEDYSDYLKQMYDAKKQSALAQLKAAYDGSVASLDRAEEGLAEGYQTVRNETAGAHEQARRNFAEFAAANGLNSGAAGQAELTRGVSLQNNMNTIRTAEASALADLKLQRAEAETEYNAAIAQAEYTGEYELAAALYEEKVRVQEALIEAEIREQQYALERYKLQYQAQRDAVADQQYESEQAFAQQQYRDTLLLQQAAQALKEKEQSDSLLLAQAQLAQKQQAAQAEQLLAQQKQQASADSAAKDRLADYGEAYLKAGILPTSDMLQAMGITAEDARKYITGIAVGK